MLDLLTWRMRAICANECPSARSFWAASQRSGVHQVISRRVSRQASMVAGRHWPSVSGSGTGSNPPSGS